MYQKRSAWFFITRPISNSLFEVLIRFREDAVALMADTEAMFHQVHARLPK